MGSGWLYVAGLPSNAKDGRAGLSAHPEQPEADPGCAARAAQRRRIVPIFSGTAKRRGVRVVGIAERTLSAVFTKSGVKDAHAHRYRHTLATRLLEQGATFEQVAEILGSSPAVVRKHYGKWYPGRQNNIDRLMMAHFETMLDTIPVSPQSHEKMEAINFKPQK